MHKVEYIALTFKFSREGNRWNAFCEELGTATFGRSIPEAEKILREAVLLHLNTLEEVGERERFFKEHNIQLHYIKPKDITVRLPVEPRVFIQSHIQRIPQLCAA